ncbi:MAG TPA: hypothetical protein VGD64_15020 [Acidisarcina sp.]
MSAASGERIIATYLSSENNCHCCQSIYGATAAAHLDGNEDLVQHVKHDFHSAEVSPRLKTPLNIAGKAQQDGKDVTVQLARDEGATDLEIHDTVLIAAAFCMYNRYVDGLATPTCTANAARWLPATATSPPTSPTYLNSPNWQPGKHAPCS